VVPLRPERRAVGAEHDALSAPLRTSWSAVVTAALLLTFGPAARAENKKPGLFDFQTWKSPVAREREAAHELAPAPLDLTPLGEPRAQPLVLRLRVYADRDYRSQVMHWQSKLRGQIDRVNRVVGPLYGARFEIESVKDWDRAHAGLPLEAALDELRALDGARDVDFVLGLVTPFRGVATNIHLIGIAPISSRHFVLRGMDDAEEGKALEREFAMLQPGERDKLYADRKGHKEVVIFLHEWAHALGALHVEERTAIMNPAYDPKQTAFTDFEKQLVGAVLERRARDRGRPFPETDEVRRMMQTAPREEGSAAERAMLMQILAKRDDGAPAQATATSVGGKGGAPASALAPLEEALEKLRANDVAGATPLVLDAARQASGAGVSADTQLRVAEAAAAVGAFTAADAALARAGAGAARGQQLAAQLAAARAHVALPPESAKLGVAPDDEPRYVAAYWLAIRAVESRDRAAAERRLAELAAAFPESAGRDVAACELALSGKRAPEAEKSCQAALAKDPNALRAHLALGRIAARARRYPDAEKRFKRALMLDPADPTAWSELGRLYRAMGASTEHDRLSREYEALYSRPLPP
jgi:hypothetical protein